MPMKFKINFYPDRTVEFPTEDIQLDEEEEGGDYLFDPEAGRASDNPFAHLALKDTPDDSAVSKMSVSKYVEGEE